MCALSFDGSLNLEQNQFPPLAVVRGTVLVSRVRGSYEVEPSPQWNLCAREREQSTRRHLSLVTNIEVSLIVLLLRSRL